MSVSDNLFVIPNPLTTAANSIAEEASASTSVTYVAPVDMDIEQFGLLVAVALGNTVTNATGFVLAKLNAAGTETVLERLVIANNADGLYVGDADVRGGSVAAATTLAYAANALILKRPASHHIRAGELIRMRGSTTVGSATGDVVPFVVCRAAGAVPAGTNVYVEGPLTRNQ